MSDAVNYDMEIGQQLRQLRLEYAVTQADLGRILGVARGSIARYETGARPLSVEQLLRLADAFGIPGSRLLPARHQEAVDMAKEESSFESV